MSTTVQTIAFNLSVIQDAFLGESLDGFDIAVIIIYFLSVLAVGIWSMYSTNRSTVRGYFLAGRSIPWWPVGASLFSSNIGSGHFVGLAGSGAASGIAVGTYEWNAMFIVLVLAWIFLPVYIASAVVTMPEYLRKRFGGQRLRICIAALTLFLYIFTKISVDLYAGAIFIHEALKWELYPSVILLLAITGFYTIGGGLAAVIYTDTLQTGIIILGAFVLMVVGFVNIGGYPGLVGKYMNATPTYTLLSHPHCGIPRNDSFHVFREVTDEDFPWTGVVIGMPLLSIWYWCSDQVIVQRTLASKNLTHAKGGAILCSYLKVLPMFMMVMVGMMSRANFPGVRGLMMSVVLAALMSSLTSVFNSSSTIFTIDVWKKFRSKATERELMIVGRLFIAVLVVLSILWIPVIQVQEGGQLFTYIQKISSYFQPPIAVCFLLAIFWKRTSEKGVFWGIIVGLIIGIIKLMLDFTHPPPSCGEEDTRPSVIQDVHYLHFAIILAIISAIIMVAISLLSPTIPDCEYGGLTWWTRHDPLLANIKTENSCLVAHDEIAIQHDDLAAHRPVIKNDAMTMERVNDNDLGQPDVVPRLHLPVETTTFSENQVDFGYEATRTVGASTDPTQTETTPYLKKIFGFLCGLEYSSKSKTDDIEQNNSIQSLEEDPFWRKFANYNMVICIIFAVIMYIVFR